MVIRFRIPANCAVINGKSRTCSKENVSWSGMGPSSSLESELADHHGTQPKIEIEKSENSERNRDDPTPPPPLLPFRLLLAAHPPSVSRNPPRSHAKNPCRADRGIDTMVVVAVGGSAGAHSGWGTWEELILGSAVLRHGGAAWSAVADELRSRSPCVFSPEVCTQP
jgi:hypothetical protein